MCCSKDIIREQSRARILMYVGESPDVRECDDLGRAHSTEVSLVSGTNLTLHLVKHEAAGAHLRRNYDDARRPLHVP